MDRYSRFIYGSSVVESFAIVKQLRQRSRGQLGCLSDLACTVNVTNIDWGILDPGSSVTRTVYVKNIGNVAETLSMTVSSWSPSIAGSYLAVAWDRQGAILSAGQVVQATFTLTVSANVTGVTDFSNVLVVSGMH